MLFRRTTLDDVVVATPRDSFSNFPLGPRTCDGLKLLVVVIPAIFASIGESDQRDSGC